MTYSIVARVTGHRDTWASPSSRTRSRSVRSCRGARPASASSRPRRSPNRRTDRSGVDLMRGGKNATQALDALIAADAMSSVRQVAMVDANGVVAVHTGERTIAEAGHANGDGYSCQANMMLSDGVPEAMAAAFESTSGALPERLLAALDAAEGRGGDIRGRQSAAMLVVKAERTPHVARRMRPRATRRGPRGATG